MKFEDGSRNAEFFESRFGLEGGARYQEAKRNVQRTEKFLYSITPRDQHAELTEILTNHEQHLVADLEALGAKLRSR